MAKTKVSQWDENPANNTDINGINIGENCSPSNINNAIRETMAQIKDWQDGTSRDQQIINANLAVNGNLYAGPSGIMYVNGGFYLDSQAGKYGDVLMSVGDVSTPVWKTLGTMSVQNAGSVNIQGGGIGGDTKTGISNSIRMALMGSNSIGTKTVSTVSPSGGNDGDIWYQI